jgi:hypothetical protein
MSTPSPSMTFGLSQSRHHHSPATERLPSTSLYDLLPGPPTSATASPVHPATRRPVPQAPRPRHQSSIIISPLFEHHCRGDAAMVSLLPPYHHPRVPLGPGFLPGTTFSGESPLAGRNHPAKGRIESPASLLG